MPIKCEADEIVKALRGACTGCNPTPCCELEVLGPAAADLIESLQAQFAAYKKYGEPCDWRDAKADAEKIAWLEAENLDLAKMIVASQRREKAAVKDIPHNCYYCANARADGGCKCLPDGDKFSPDYVEGFDRDNCEHWQQTIRPSDGAD